MGYFLGYFWVMFGMLILDAILGIQDGQNPKVIEGILKNYIAESKRQVSTEE